MIRDLLIYTDLADKRVVNTFIEADKPLPEAERLFGHVLNAQHVWVSRIKGIKPEFESWTLQNQSSFKQLQEQNISALLQLLESLDLSQEIEYRSFAGEPFKSVISDILLHVVNHSTYHRAQIAAQFKQSGITPPVTDYVFLKREGLF